jgi:hypothetical protein
LKHVAIKSTNKVVLMALILFITRKHNGIYNFKKLIIKVAFRIPAELEDISLFHRVPTGTGTNLSSYLIGTGEVFLRVE